MTVVVHISEPYDVYIGRAGKGADGYFGNSHSIGTPCPRCAGKVHDRADCLAAFQTDFDQRIATDPTYRERVLALKGKRLGCFCKRPGTTTPCHGDILTAWLDRQGPTVANPTPPLITSFSGEYRFLSNFSPCQIEWRGLRVPTSEAAYQLSKTDDPVWMRRIAAAKTPAEAKQLGRDLACRPSWDRMKVKVMAQILTRKFADSELRAKLLATGDARLVEGNTWGDVFWGVDRRSGQGENMLGRLLMTLRTTLRAEAAHPQPRPLTKVISGGQVGADQAGLATAEAFGVPTGGWAPKGWITSRGPDPALLRDRYKLQEHPTAGYPPRTEANVRDADGTIRLARDFTTPGERCTLRAITQHGKPYCDIDLTQPRPVVDTLAWIRAHNIHVLNVAGNREHPRTPAVFKAACLYLRDVFVALGYERVPRA